MKAKTVAEIIAEDEGLGEKLTYEEFMERQNKAGNIDDSVIEDAYAAYLQILSKQEAEENG